MATPRDASSSLDERASAVLARIAHEMRQPLTAAAAAVSIIKQCDDPGRRVHVCGVLERQYQRLTRLLEDLLVTARVGSEIITLTREEIDLARLVVDITDAFQPVVADKGQRLDVLVPGQPCQISGDRTRLEQVFSNVLTNSTKYTDPGGCLWTTLDASDGHAIVTVGDNGRGIPADVLPRVFDMFTTGTDPGHGLGVGLAVARKLVELHGGTISAYSAGAGKGTQIEVRLPRLASTTPIAA